MKPIPIGAAKRIADNHDYDQVVIIARKVGEGEHVTTYGRDGQHGEIAARIGNFLKREILKWEGVPEKSWLSIETAPKDGTWILVAYPHFNHNNQSADPDEYQTLLVRWNGLGWDTGVWMLHERVEFWLPVPIMEKK